MGGVAACDRGCHSRRSASSFGSQATVRRRRPRPRRCRVSPQSEFCPKMRAACLWCTAPAASRKSPPPPTPGRRTGLQIARFREIPRELRRAVYRAQSPDDSAPPGVPRPVARVRRLPRALGPALVRLKRAAYLAGRASPRQASSVPSAPRASIHVAGSGTAADWAGLVLPKCDAQRA